VVGADDPPHAARVPPGRPVQRRTTAGRLGAPADDVTGHVLAARRRAVKRELDTSRTVAKSAGRVVAAALFLPSFGALTSYNDQQYFSLDDGRSK